MVFMLDRFSKLHVARIGRRPRGFVLIMAAVMLVFIIPLVGLAVDGGILYAVKTKLSMACDAGALAGARALARGMDDATQTATAQAVAQEYIVMNFPNNYFGTPAPAPPTPVVDESVPNQRSVTVSASVSVPLYFLRWLNATATTVSATSTAVRRDVNVSFVMDRSGSLADTGSCVPLQQAAISFVNKFANSRDNVSLVTFATSSRPDFPMANNFLSASPSVPTILGELTCTGDTNTSQGLWQGYSQSVALNQPNALNVLLLFTDGYPSAVTATYPISASSTCNSQAPQTAVLGAGFNYGAPTVPTAVGGLWNQLAPPQPMASDGAIANVNYAGCTYASNWPNSEWSVASDVTYMPNTDLYGNAMNTNYQPVTYYDANGDIHLDPTSVMNAAWNAADSAGYRIRQGAAVPGVGGGITGVTVFTIGLGNFGGVPADFLERVANDPRASNYDSTKPTGLYIYAPTSAELSDAFSTIASEILHLAK
jgi:Flp pilus assembly protein TadG